MLQKYLCRLSPGLLSSLILLAILWLTLAPHPVGDNGITLFEHADKLVHFLMFFALAGAMLFDRELLCQRKYEATGRLPRRGGFAVVCILISTVAIGGVIELLQGAMEMGRGADWLDFAADTAGAFAAIAFAPSIIRQVMCR